MFKISKIRPYENNKSCSILHHESNKIGCEIFFIFYNVLGILQDSVIHMYYFSYHLVVRPLKRFALLQCGPWPWPAAREAEIRWLRRGDWLGKVGKTTRDSPRFGLGAWLGSGSRRRWGSAAWPGGGRRELCSGEVAAAWKW
jgi:hypothetical protein